MQTQLIELRTTNYTLKDQHTKQTAGKEQLYKAPTYVVTKYVSVMTEISRLREAVNSTSQELEKANKVCQGGLVYGGMVTVCGVGVVREVLSSSLLHTGYPEK